MLNTYRLVTWNIPTQKIQIADNQQLIANRYIFHYGNSQPIAIQI